MAGLTYDLRYRTEFPQVQVGPFKDRLGVKVVPSGEGGTRLLPDGPRAMSRLLLARKLAGQHYDAVIRSHLYHFDDALEMPWVIGGAGLKNTLSFAGLETRIDEVAAAGLESLYLQEQAPLRRWFPRGEGETLEWELREGGIDQTEVEANSKLLEYLGWTKGYGNALLGFTWTDVCQSATKRDVLGAQTPGLGKTRFALALSELYRHKERITSPTVVIALKKHLRPWREEIPQLKPLVTSYGKDLFEDWVDKKDKPKFDRPFLLVSFDRLVRMDAEELETLRELMKGSVVILDEAYVVANPTSNRSKVLATLSGKHHIGLSGTPIRNYSINALFPLAWIFRGGSSQFPNYSFQRQGAEQRWNADFTVWAVEDSGSRKKTPLLKNPEKFEAMLAPLMIRRLRNEPEVVAELGPPKLVEHYHKVELDQEHLEHYDAVLQSFTSWYYATLESRGEGAKILQNEILVKLGYLLRSVAAPWVMERPETAASWDLTWPEFERGPTALHRKALEIAREYTDLGHQVVIFSKHVAPLELMAETLEKAGIRAAAYHGGITEKKRDGLVTAFRQNEFQVMCANFDTLAEAVTLVNACAVILMETDWPPTVARQAVGRIDRASQQAIPHAHYLIAHGTVQQYQVRVSTLKTMGIEAALDGRTQDLDVSIPDLSAYAVSLITGDARQTKFERDYNLDFDWTE